MILLHYYSFACVKDAHELHSHAKLDLSSTIDSGVDRQPRRTAVKSEFTVGTNTLVGSRFGLSVGLDSSFRLLVGRRQCFTDACVFCARHPHSYSTTVKCVWTVQGFLCVIFSYILKLSIAEANEESKLSKIVFVF